MCTVCIDIHYLVGCLLHLGQMCVLHFPDHMLLFCIRWSDIEMATFSKKYNTIQLSIYIALLP